MKYGGGVQLKKVRGAGDLESWYGARIREDADAQSLGAEALRGWLENKECFKA